MVSLMAASLFAVVAGVGGLIYTFKGGLKVISVPITNTCMLGSIPTSQPMEHKSFGRAAAAI